MGNGGGVAGGASGHGFILPAEGAVELAGGERADLTMAEGLAAAEARLDAGQLAEIRALAAAQGYRLAGGALVAEDAFARRAADRRAGGPQSAGRERSELDEEVGAFFTANGVADPYHADTLPGLERRLAGTAELASASGALAAYYADPTLASAGAVTRAVDGLAAAHGAGSSVMEVLYLVFRESIREASEDKRYFLLALQDFNRMAEELSRYLDTLTEASQRLSQRAKDLGDDGHKATVGVEVRDYDLSALDAAGRLRYDSQTKPLAREDLNLEIKRLEAAQEKLRNERQVASTAFQNFDQKSNQLFTMMAAVLKTMNDMRAGTIRNML